MNSFRHLTQEERNIIEQRLISGESFKSIARELGKDPTTIAREVKNHIQFRKTGCYGKVFNDCKHRFGCPVMHLCGNLRCRHYCRFCKSHTCLSLCREYQKEICSRLSKPPYVCNGCEKKLSCTLEKRIYSATLPVVEMDTVVGRTGGKVLLTLHFTVPQLMLAFIRDANTSQSVIDIFDQLYLELGRTLSVNCFRYCFVIMAVSSQIHRY
jgi:hypothetical protein